MESVSLGAAFFAGLLSFASPCVLPMLPTFLLILTGSGDREGKTQLLPNTLSFLAGFTVVFLLMGATASALGQLALANWDVLEKLAGLLLILLGIFLSGLWTPAALMREHRPFLQRRREGRLGAFLLGAAFTFGWTPCTGPILAAILLYAGSRATLSEGLFLLLAYALGFALPFLALVFLWGRIGQQVARIYPYLPALQKALGLFLIAFGVAMLLGLTLRLTAFLNSLAF